MIKALIDVGSTSVRLSIVSIEENGEIVEIESARQAIALGRNTFRVGSISAKQSREVVDALLSFKKLLHDYSVDPSTELIALAGSAVKEASNSDVFLDQVAVATGIQLNFVDDLEFSKYIYISLKEWAENQHYSFTKETLVCEVGGGTTSLLLLRNNSIVATYTTHLGSLRTVEHLAEGLTGADDFQLILESHMQSSVESILNNYPFVTVEKMLVFGNEIERVVRILAIPRNAQGVAVVSVEAIESLAEQLAPLSVKEVRQRYNIKDSSPYAFRSALLAYISLARGAGLTDLSVIPISATEGILLDGSGRLFDLNDQIRGSALEIGRKFHFDEAHAHRVASFAGTIFDTLATVFGLPLATRVLLTTAAYLHDIGKYVSGKKHHVHSHYIICNSNLFGLSCMDVEKIAFLARYHRKNTPENDPFIQGYIHLSEGMVLKKLVEILKVADALDVGRGSILDIECTLSKNSFLIRANALGSLNMEKVVWREKGLYFSHIFGRDPLVQTIIEDWEDGHV